MYMFPGGRQVPGRTGRFWEEEEGGRDGFFEGGGADAGTKEGVEVGVVDGVEEGAEESRGGGGSSL